MQTTNALKNPDSHLGFSIIRQWSEINRQRWV